MTQLERSNAIRREEENQSDAAADLTKQLENNQSLVTTPVTYENIFETPFLISDEEAQRISGELLGLSLESEIQDKQSEIKNIQDNDKVIDLRSLLETLKDLGVPEKLIEDYIEKRFKQIQESEQVRGEISEDLKLHASASFEEIVAAKNELKREQELSLLIDEMISKLEENLNYSRTMKAEYLVNKNKNDCKIEFRLNPDEFTDKYTKYNFKLDNFIYSCGMALGAGVFAAGVSIVGFFTMTPLNGLVFLVTIGACSAFSAFAIYALRNKYMLPEISSTRSQAIKKLLNYCYNNGIQIEANSECHRTDSILSFKLIN